MSQHILSLELNGKQVDIQMGWDRPLQEFFMNVSADLEDEDEDEDDDGVTDDYFSLYDQDADSGNLDYFIKVAAKMGITFPPAMVEQVKNDAQLNIGNRHVVWSADGSITKETIW